MEFTPATHGQVLAFLWRYTRRHGVLLACMMVLLLVSTALHLLGPFFYKEVVDLAAGVDHVSADVAKQATFYVLMGVLFGAASITLIEFSYFLLANIETEVMRAAHMDTFSHVQRLSTRFHVNAFAGATARKIGRGTDALERLLDIFWFNVLPLIVVSIGFTIVLSIFAPVVGIAILCCMLLYIPITVGLNLYLMRFNRWADEQDTKVTASLVDSITGNATVKSFSGEGREDHRHGGVLSEWRHRTVTTWHLGTVTGWFQSIFMMVSASAWQLPVRSWPIHRFLFWMRRQAAWTLAPRLSFSAHSRS